MSRRSRALAVIWGTAVLLAAPWAIDYAIRRARSQPWRPPAAPSIRLATPPRPVRRPR